MTALFAETYRALETMRAKNWSVVLALFLIGCDREKLPLIQTTHLEQQAPFRATVVWVDVHDMREFPGEHGPMVIITLQKETGERMAIGGDEQTRAFEGFSRMLRKGASYQFPTAWLDYKKDFEARNRVTNSAAAKTP